MSENSGVSPGMEAEWHVEVRGTPTGPLALSDIQQLASQGKIDAMSRVWRKGMAEWVLIGKIPELTALLPPPRDAASGAASKLAKPTLAKTIEEKARPLLQAVEPHARKAVEGLRARAATATNAPGPLENSPKATRGRTQFFGLKTLAAIYSVLAVIVIGAGIISLIGLSATDEPGMGLLGLLAGTLAGVCLIAFSELIQLLMRLENNSERMRETLDTIAQLLRPPDNP